MNVKMATMEAVLRSVPTLVEASSVPADLATSSRERRRRKGLGVGVAVGESGRILSTHA